ncbi:hypothetical protein [Oceaniferula spumae]
MQQQPPNNDVNPMPSSYDPDVQAAINAAAAAAEMDDPVNQTPTESIAPIPQAAQPNTVQATAQAVRPTTQNVVPEQKKPDTESIKISHEHGDGFDEAEYDAMLNQAFAEREARQARRRKIARVTTVASFLTIFGGAAGWYGYSADNRAIAQKYWDDTAGIVESVQKGTDTGEILDTYDQALDKIAVRKDQVDEASKQLGVDPTVDDPDSQAKLAEDMKAITGDARTVLDRDAEMQKRFGKMAEAKRAEIEAERNKKQNDTQ